ncbi:hypothetical protein X777_01186 [Ooceraea biroi]|uniref:Odorant receptor n=1 Tax=Ooceraea biroi TaxID=2015173 RepID=A0A026VTI9_OOCBI|nr:hypothetical protein X777_01186 [Ooceraea biroi]
MAVDIVLQYFNLNRILLLTVGLWPYQRTKLVEFQLYLVFGILVSIIPALLTPLLTLECTVSLLIKILPPVLITIICTINYFSFIIKAHAVKQIMDQLQNICTNLTDETEVDIMKNYGSKTRSYTASIILFQTVSSGHNVEEFVVHFSCLSILLLYLFLANYAAQEIIDHYNHIFITVYSIQWYAASICIQKMILFLLQRGAKAFNLNLGGLFIGSLETAGMLLSTSVSYFTVLYSTR